MATKLPKFLDGTQSPIRRIALPPKPVEAPPKPTIFRSRPPELLTPPPAAVSARASAPAGPAPKLSAMIFKTRPPSLVPRPLAPDATQSELPQPVAEAPRPAAEAPALPTEATPRPAASPTRLRPVVDLPPPPPVPGFRVVPLGRLAQGGRWRTEAMRGYPNPVLMWFTRGQGRFTMAGVTRGFGAHNAFFLPPGTMHGFEVTAQVYRQRGVLRRRPPSWRCRICRSTCGSASRPSRRN